MTDVELGESTKRPLRLPPKWWLFVLTGVVTGIIVGRVIPPPYPDGQWWGTFLTSAGFGGSLAVVGATVAALVALHNSRNDRTQKQKASDLSQWWDRFTWACEKAVSTTPGESEMGLSVLTALIDTPWATEEDNEMALGVANVITSAMTTPESSAPTTPKKGLWKR